MKLRRRRREFNQSDPSLFDWAEKSNRRVRVPYPARWLQRNHPMTPERALLIARLAGLGGGE